MKNKSCFWVFMLVLVSILLGGCVKTQYVVMTPDTIRDKAARERAKESFEAHQKASKKHLRWVQNQTEWKRDFALSCPFGGEGEVVIHDHLGSQLTYWRGGGAQKILMRRVVMLNRAKNPYSNLTVNIYGDGQRVVSNMCPGGSITLVSSIPPVVGGQSKRVIWTAEGVIDGRLAYGESRTGQIWQGWARWEVQMNRPSWVMNLNRVDKEF
jgi:hypothetical protein